MASGLRGTRGSLVGSLVCVVVVLLLASHDLRPLLEAGHDHGSAMIAGLLWHVRTPSPA